jgi:hypothetical protein
MVPLGRSVGVAAGRIGGLAGLSQPLRGSVVPETGRGVMDAPRNASVRAERPSCAANFKVPIVVSLIASAVGSEKIQVMRDTTADGSPPT